jgi:hypothetical protein
MPDATCASSWTCATALSPRGPLREQTAFLRRPNRGALQSNKVPPSCVTVQGLMSLVAECSNHVVIALHRGKLGAENELVRLTISVARR